MSEDQTKHEIAFATRKVKKLGIGVNRKPASGHVNLQKISRPLQMHSSFCLQFIAFRHAIFPSILSLK